MLQSLPALFERLEADTESSSIFDTVDPLNPDAMPTKLGEEEENTQLTMIGEILLGLGIVLQLATWFTQSFLLWSTYLRLFLTLGAAGVWVWGFLKWLDSQEQPTDRTMFRSWRVNFLNFWVTAGVTVINSVLSFVLTTNTSTFTLYAPYVACFLGASATIAGIFLGWRMLNLWWTYDPSGALASEDFDYFQWTDVTDDSTEAESEVESSEEEPVDSATVDGEAAMFAF